MKEMPKNLQNDPDGMLTYEYIVNNADDCIDIMGELFDNLKERDLTGQYLASSARYLNAVGHDRFEKWIRLLIQETINKDRERKYIGSLLKAIWGDDYMENADKLAAEDDNFRRIYKRIYPMGNR